MAERARQGRGLLEWAVAAAPLAGQQANGDLHVVVEHAEGALIVVIDALGHGPAAELEARRAAAIFASSPRDPFVELIRRCHQALTGRRGVVLSLASIDPGTGLLEWAGVGNVEGVLLHRRPGRQVSRSGLVIIGGVVGGDLPEVRSQQLPIDPGDVLVFATDGLRREFVEMIDPTLACDTLAADLLARCAKGTDDALVLVARYLGPTA